MSNHAVFNNMQFNWDSKPANIDVKSNKKSEE